MTLMNVVGSLPQGRQQQTPINGKPANTPQLTALNRLEVSTVAFQNIKSKLMKTFLTKRDFNEMKTTHRARCQFYWLMLICNYVDQILASCSILAIFYFMVLHLQY